MDLSFPNDSQKGSHLNNFLNATDFTNLVQSPTRGPALLDVILTNQPNNFEVAKTIDDSTSFSDHKMVKANSITYNQPLYIQSVEAKEMFQKLLPGNVSNSFEPYTICNSHKCFL